MNDTDPEKDILVAEPDTTPPDPVDAAPPGNWQMPEPKFQQSSGYLPQGYIEQFGLGDNKSSGAATAPAMAPPSAPSADVEPQPDLAEQLSTEPVPAPAPPVVKQRSKGGRIFLILLGLLGMALFIAVFLGVIWYLFLAPQNGSSTF